MGARLFLRPEPGPGSRAPVRSLMKVWLRQAEAVVRYYPRSGTVDDLVVVASTPEPPITLVVRRGALRRFHKLKKDTANLPVVVTWDRRVADAEPSVPSAPEGDARTADGAATGPDTDRRQQPSFTWDLADFIVVPGGAADETSEEPADGTVEPEPDVVRRK